MICLARLSALVLLLNAALAASQYTLIQTYNASNFFDEFTFFTGPDPTGGFVDYVPFDQAVSLQLINNISDYIYLGVDHTDVVPLGGPGRPSVRLQSKMAFTEGLFVLALSHIPVGCGTWPAFWTVGLGDWPADGEIDIIEGVNDAVGNGAALHASGECQVTDEVYQTGTWKSTDCNIGHDKNQGCGTTFAEATSFGAPFNQNGGGVYAMEWTNETINIWFFPPSLVPPSLLSPSAVPDPQTFGIPSASFSGPCSDEFSQKFFNHTIVIDTTFCGGWGGSTFGQGFGTQCVVPQGSTSEDSCVAYVANNPEAFNETFWAIDSLRVWEKVTNVDPLLLASPTTTVQSTSIVFDIVPITVTPVPAIPAPSLGKIGQGSVASDPEISNEIYQAPEKDLAEHANEEAGVGGANDDVFTEDGDLRAVSSRLGGLLSSPDLGQLMPLVVSMPVNTLVNPSILSTSYSILVNPYRPSVTPSALQILGESATSSFPLASPNIPNVPLASSFVWPQATGTPAARTANLPTLSKSGLTASSTALQSSVQNLLSPTMNNVLPRPQIGTPAQSQTTVDTMDIFLPPFALSSPSPLNFNPGGPMQGVTGPFWTDTLAIGGLPTISPLELSAASATTNTIVSNVGPSIQGISDTLSTEAPAVAVPTSISPLNLAAASAAVDMIIHNLGGGVTQNIPDTVVTENPAVGASTIIPSSDLPAVSAAVNAAIDKLAAKPVDGGQVPQLGGTISGDNPSSAIDNTLGGLFPPPAAALSPPALSIGSDSIPLPAGLPIATAVSSLAPADLAAVTSSLASLPLIPNLPVGVASLSAIPADLAAPSDLGFFSVAPAATQAPAVPVPSLNPGDTSQAVDVLLNGFLGQEGTAQLLGLLNVNKPPTPSASAVIERQEQDTPDIPTTPYVPLNQPFQGPQQAQAVPDVASLPGPAALQDTPSPSTLQLDPVAAALQAGLAPSSLSTTGLTSAVPEAVNSVPSLSTEDTHQAVGIILNNLLGKEGTATLLDLLNIEPSGNSNTGHKLKRAIYSLSSIVSMPTGCYEVKPPSKAMPNDAAESAFEDYKHMIEGLGPKSQKYANLTNFAKRAILLWAQYHGGSLDAESVKDFARALGVPESEITDFTNSKLFKTLFDDDTASANIAPFEDGENSVASDSPATFNDRDTTPSMRLTADSLGDTTMNTPGDASSMPSDTAASYAPSQSANGYGFSHNEATDTTGFATTEGTSSTSPAGDSQSITGPIDVTPFKPKFDRLGNPNEAPIYLSSDEHEDEDYHDDGSNTWDLGMAHGFL